MWDSIVKILEQKVKEGVEVRILYDGMNSFSNLPHDYPKELEAKGIHCRIFNPIRRRSRQARITAITERSS